MKRFFGLAILAFVALSWFSPASMGQPRFLPPNGEGIPPRSYQDFDWKGDPEEILKQQLDHVKYWKNVMKFLNDSNRNFGDLDIKNLPNIKLDPATISSLKKIVDEWKSDTRISPTKVEEIKKALQKAQDANKITQDGNDTPQPNIPTPLNPMKMPAPPQPTAEDRFNEWLADMATEVTDSDFGRALLQSDAWRNTVEQMQMSLLNPNGQAGSDDWKKLIDDLPFPTDFDFSWMENGLAKFENMSPPDLPDWNVSAPSFDGMPIPSMPGGGASSGWSIFQTVMWSIFAVVVAVLAWQVARRLRFAAPQAEVSAWRLGPWPVHPSQIMTQAEFIKAFDYLAVLLFGREICTSNHHQIAEKLSADSVDEEMRRAVDYLTKQYEQARYAPAEQPITAETRRQLQLIAGPNAT